MQSNSGRNGCYLRTNCFALWETEKCQTSWIWTSVPIGRHGYTGTSCGELSGAGHFETWDLQKLLLWEEGVEAVWNGTVWSVDLKKYGWKNTLEEAEELAALFCGA